MVKYKNRGGKFFGKLLVGKSRMFYIGIVVALISGCASVTSDNRAESLGASAVIGGILGAVHCLATDSEDCAKDILIGGVLGAIAGEVAYRIRASYAKRDEEIEEISKETGIKTETDTHVVLEKEKEKEFEKKIKQTPKAQQIEVAREQAAYRSVMSEVFASGSTIPLPMAENALREIANAYLKDGMRDVLIVGHTDDTGTAVANQRLSEQRAQAIARIFIEQGHSPDKIYYQGAGESEPIADNATVVGRSKNRRVEVVDANGPAALARAKRIFIRKSQSQQQESLAAVPESKSQPEPELQSQPSAPAKPVKALIAIDSVIDFGGEPLAKNVTSELLQYAKANDDSSAFFISKAHASTAQSIPSFVGDDLPVSGAIKRSDSGNAELYDFSDYMPGYKNAVVYAHFNQQLFSMHPVSLLQEREVATPQIAPVVYQKINGEWEKRHQLIGSAVAYPADNNESLALYRWKADDATVKQTGILGADILVRRFEKADFGKSHKLPTQVYYYKNGIIHTETTVFTIKLPKDINPEWRFF